MCWNKFRKLSTSSDHQIIDDNQKEYRKKFGITDKYLLEYVIDDKDGADNSFIIFIDHEYAIDWIDNRDRSTWDKDDLSKFHDYTARLEMIQSYPIFNLTNKEKLAFKIMLGAAYILVFHRRFEHVDEAISKAVSFFEKRSSENARKYCLSYSGGLTFVGCMAMLLFRSYECLESQTFMWSFAVFMGALGAYVSIWGRYTRYELEGVSSKWLYVLESLSRLFIGGIFAFIALLIIKCGLAFPFVNADIEIYAYALCGFAAGLNERFIPSLVEKMTVNKQ